jgi:hypothetical protein
VGIVSTKILAIGDLLQNKQLRIPDYQRPYKWSTKSVSQLLDDIHQFSERPSYRIGAIVIHAHKNELNIVDGQQRTITFLLIVKAILTHRYSRFKNEDLKILLASIRENLFPVAFKSDISKKNIQENYREVERKIDTWAEDLIAYFLQKCEVTVFTINEISEAFQFFDSQNARGKDLEPHDLLKAYHLRELDIPSGHVSPERKLSLVKTWENMSTETLSHLFSEFLFRVRGWASGRSSRYFTKENIALFKGVNLAKKEDYPYVQLYQMVDKQIEASEDPTKEIKFPFQLDQPILNGGYFFEMITHYHTSHSKLKEHLESLAGRAGKIVKTINEYEEKKRAGDKYSRMLFDCAVLHYIDKFGEKDLSTAVEKIFIWSYTPRVYYESLYLASVDNYAVGGTVPIQSTNLFKTMRDASHREEVLRLNLPIVRTNADNTPPIKDLFIEMKYYDDRNQ